MDGKGMTSMQLGSELKEKVSQCFHLVADNGTIGLHGLFKFRKALTEVLGVHETALGDLRGQILRFDINGDGRLDEHEAFACVKSNLLEYRKKLGHQSSSFIIPTTSPATAGYRVLKEIGHGNQSRAHLGKNAGMSDAVSRRMKRAV